MGSESEIIALIKGLKTSLSGLSISDSITTQISGQTIIAKISGETILAKISGETIIAAISGETVVARISGQIVDAAIRRGSLMMADNVGNTQNMIGDLQGFPVYLVIFPYVYNGTYWDRLRGTISGGILAEITNFSGKIIIGKISGETIIARISGETVIGKISGESVGLASGTGPIIARISGDTIIGKISGETVIAKISGETIVGKVSGETIVGKISGETIIGKVSGEIIDVKVPTSVKTGLIRVVTAASGGAVLHSGTVNAVIIKADAGNSGDIYVGGAVNLPYSGFGFPLDASEAINLNVDDFNRLYLCATMSGEKVGFLGIV